MNAQEKKIQQTVMGMNAVKFIASPPTAMIQQQSSPQQHQQQQQNKQQQNKQKQQQQQQNRKKKSEPKPKYKQTVSTPFLITQSLPNIPSQQDTSSSKDTSSSVSPPLNDLSMFIGKLKGILENDVKRMNQLKVMRKQTWKPIRTLRVQLYKLKKQIKQQQTNKKGKQQQQQKTTTTNEEGEKKIEQILKEIKKLQDERTDNHITTTPPIYKHLLIGVNEVTKALEKCDANNQSIALVFIGKGQITEHLILMSYMRQIALAQFTADQYKEIKSSINLKSSQAVAFLSSIFDDDEETSSSTTTTTPEYKQQLQQLRELVTSGKELFKQKVIDSLPFVPSKITAKYLPCQIIDAGYTRPNAGQNPKKNNYCKKPKEKPSTSNPATAQKYNK
ncbi:hypothetical protein DFA_06930 [Cavenderia fasciculata]|uniref:Uncharacterized protein n=1 Tax=Cavenderia fasciculata TaxID=261658 RepID=F4PX25_CACFS|nr:uncharacterized protein DFA_06930 [Cavenderia fasciculata]EGG19828.1 hypothetical protein DFA_06930 [Cavenderia fasciculata]|eukprot:XP_004358174.1 hypothetical protein DFA_06930 [Cavenderia fasciculata]